MARPTLRADIEWLNTTPTDKLRFKDFSRLRVGGKDEWSGLWGDGLAAKLDPADVAAVAAELPPGRGRDAALRWVARGLRPELAVRKVRTDREVSERAGRA